VPSAASSAAELSPPAPHWMPTSGLGFSPARCTSLTSRTCQGRGQERTAACSAGNEQAASGRNGALCGRHGLGRVGGGSSGEVEPGSQVRGKLALGA